MLTRSVIALALFGCLIIVARADDLVSPTLPTLALDPQPVVSPTFNSSATSPWNGFYIGSEVVATSRKNAKGAVGGDALAGYNHEFGNQIVLGVETSAGFAPTMFTHSPATGYDFASTKFKLGYDLGRFMPYLSAGVTLARPTTVFTGGFVNATDSVNNLFSSSSHLRTSGSVSAGFDYALTNSLTVGIAVSANKGVGFPTWP